MTTTDADLTAALWITEREVCELMDLPGAISVVAAALRAQASGGAWTMEKTHATWGGGHTLHALGGGLERVHSVGTKTWAHTDGGATPLLVLWDARTGRLDAVVEAFALGQLRTGAVSGVATDVLAPARTEIAAVLGTGKQALAQVAAIVAVRPLRTIRVWSPTRDHRVRFGHEVEAAGLGVEVEAANDLGAAIADVQVLTTATRAREPFLTDGLVPKDVHVNAIGAISPERRELGPDLVARAQLVVADSPLAARANTTELATAAAVVPLTEMVSAGYERQDDAGPTIFKAMGIGLADVALGTEVVRRARAKGAGVCLDQPFRWNPTLVRRHK